MIEDDFSYLPISLRAFLKAAGFSGSVRSVKKIKYPTGVLTTIGITGDKVGFLTLTMSEGNAVSLAKRFANLMEIPIASQELSDSHLEALAELTNQIAGRVVMFMEDHKLNCSITPPTVMSGGGISFSLNTMKVHRIFKISLKTSYFYVSIGIK
ncbi:MAG: chemotaxis protein CheX [Spirochaetales bacterium]|nr:chemotaxis protein CheX [Spirochaetales bacterium]